MKELNNMIKCLIIDDEPAAIEVLEHFIKLTPGLQLHASVTDPLEGLKILDGQQIDLIFLDVHMPRLSGIDFIQAINAKYKVILTTAYSKYALDGFNLNVVDYLVKPIPFPRFLKAIQKAKDQIDAGLRKNSVDQIAVQSEFILVKGENKGKFIKIEIADIDYVEGMGNYAAICCNGKKILALINMKDIAAKLPERKFLRVHKSFIVALEKITAIDGNAIKLKNYPHTNILIGKTYKDVFFDAIRSRLIS